MVTYTYQLIDREVDSSACLGKTNSITLGAEYCQHCFNLQLEAMAIRYPVTQKLLGELRFEKIVKQYLASFPLVSGSIDDVGLDFCEFLKSTNLSKAFPYLCELAKFEWLVASLPQDKIVKSNLSKIYCLIFRKLQNVEVRLSPNVELFLSYFGAVEIWLGHRADSNQSTQFAGKMSNYWIIKQTVNGLSLTPIAQTEYLFYRQIKNNVSIGSLNLQFGEKMLDDLLLPLLHSQQCLLI